MKMSSLDIQFRFTPVPVYAYNGVMLVTPDVVHVTKGLGTEGCMLITN